MTMTLERQPQPPHRETSVSMLSGEWIARCHCGFQTRRLSSEADARRHLTDHITYLTTVGENEPE